MWFSHRPFASVIRTASNVCAYALGGIDPGRRAKKKSLLHGYTEIDNEKY